MSESRWYYEKAKECGRRAEAAASVAIKAGYIRDQNNWNEIADRIVSAELAAQAKKPKA
jgi:hypothetical protein